MDENKEQKAIIADDKVYLIDEFGNVSIILNKDYVKDKIPVDNRFLKALEDELKSRKGEGNQDE